ncbi:MAG: hypothetical protein AAFN81_33735 [Bacteroidota bacterium]
MGRMLPFTDAMNRVATRLLFARYLKKLYFAQKGQNLLLWHLAGFEQVFLLGLIEIEANEIVPAQFFGKDFGGAAAIEYRFGNTVTSPPKMSFGVTDWNFIYQRLDLRLGHIYLW